RPLAAVAQLVDYAGHVRARLPLVRAPVLVLQSRDDAVVAAEGPRLIAGQAGGRVDVQWVEVPEGPRHILTLARPRVRAEVFAAIARFVERDAAGAADARPAASGGGS
ncbi:MAG TPA: hypothetical protein VFX28_19075, partial [Methylomirabilota bacterium]|nr:hypothetical protein [Methylomirabilota bacterium]